MPAPGGNIFLYINGISRRPRLGVEFSNLRARFGLNELSSRTAESNAIDFRKPIYRLESQGRQEFFEGKLPFSGHHHVGARVEVLVGVGTRLGPTDDDLPAAVLSYSQNLHYITPGHQICINAEHRRRALLQYVVKFLPRGERGIEYFDRKTLVTQVRADVENAQGGVGLHDLKFLGIFVQEISVSEEDIHNQFGNLNRAS